jgi:hypothetical protein
MSGFAWYRHLRAYCCIASPGAGIVAAVIAIVPTPCFAGLHSGSEYDALTAFYAASNGAGWTDHANWGSGDACQWFGITCDQNADPTDNTSHVTYVNITNNNLTGMIAPITALTHLQVFDVGSNQLTGNVPAIAGLGNLTNFYVYGNALTGTLPDLSGLPALIVFDADGNSLTGSIPSLSALGALITFNVGHNALSGPIPDLSGLAKLAYLDVSKNQLSGTIPALPSTLGYFYAALNHLTGAVPNPPVSLSSASLCPNPLDTTPQAFDSIWDSATAHTPWWATPFATNHCDEIYFNFFE